MACAMPLVFAWVVGKGASIRGPAPPVRHRVVIAFLRLSRIGSNTDNEQIREYP